MLNLTTRRTQYRRTGGMSVSKSAGPGSVPRASAPIARANAMPRGPEINRARVDAC